MSKKYLDKILLLCTPPQRDMFALIEAEKEIYQLSNPIALNNAEIQQRLDKLDALEMAGVDNWDGCTT